MKKSRFTTELGITYDPTKTTKYVGEMYTVAVRLKDCINSGFTCRLIELSDELCERDLTVRRMMDDLRDGRPVFSYAYTNHELIEAALQAVEGKLTGTGLENTICVSDWIEQFRLLDLCAKTIRQKCTDNTK